MIITIEKYRGFDIEFNTNSELFQCIATEDKTKESKSFAAVKRFIDEYKKNNQGFKSFVVEGVPNRYTPEPSVKIIGLRKDGRFIAELANGDKMQIGNYDMTDYMIIHNDNKPKLKELSKITAENNAQNEAFKIKKKEIIDTLDIVTLEEYKRKVIDN